MLMKLIAKKYFFETKNLHKIYTKKNSKDWDLRVNKLKWFLFFLNLGADIQSEIQNCNYWLWIIKIMFKINR